MLGRVKFFSDERGFGFIRPDGGGADVFCHYSVIENQKGRRTLLEGDRVEYDVVETEKGLAARTVVVLVSRSVVEHVVA